MLHLSSLLRRRLRNLPNSSLMPAEQPGQEPLPPVIELVPSPVPLTSTSKSPHHRVMTSGGTLKCLLYPFLPYALARHGPFRPYAFPLKSGDLTVDSAVRT